MVLLTACPSVKGSFELWNLARMIFYYVRSTSLTWTWYTSMYVLLPGVGVVVRKILVHFLRSKVIGLRLQTNIWGFQIERPFWWRWRHNQVIFPHNTCLKPLSRYLLMKWWEQNFLNFCELVWKFQTNFLTCPFATFYIKIHHWTFKNFFLMTTVTRVLRFLIFFFKLTVFVKLCNRFIFLFFWKFTSLLKTVTFSWISTTISFHS